MDTIGGQSERRNLAVKSWRWGWRLASMMEAGGTQMKMNMKMEMEMEDA